MQILLFILTFLIVTSCSSEKRDLKEIRETKVLKVLTTNTEMTYFLNRDGQKAGFEYDLVNSFAKYLDVEAQFIIKPTINEALQDLRDGKGDLVAAGLSRTEEREESYSFGPIYDIAEQKVICHKDISFKNIEGLEKQKIIVGSNTSYLERLKVLKQKYTELNFKDDSKSSTPEILKRINDGDSESRCTIADLQVFQIYRRYLPNLKLMMSFGEKESVSWVFRKAQEELKKEADKWFTSGRKKEVEALRKKYYSHISKYDAYDLNKYRQRIKSRLPKYKNLFIKAAKTYDFDWMLIAAVSYQESHWNSKAKSPTGVRGLMMLTKNTAKAMGVLNRLDPEQSIMGGAKYLRKIIERLPSYIKPLDRVWLALASYNVGFSHVRDIRGVAVWRNENPNTWYGVRSVLPLLSSRKIYRRLPYGYARGLEPVVYVDRIRNYYRILQRLEN